MSPTRLGNHDLKPAPRLIIIANPTAGRGAGKVNRQQLVESAQRDLERGGFTVDIGLETSPDAVSALAAHAARRGYTHIIAAGGDGTVNAVVNGIMRLAKNPDAKTAAQLHDVKFGVLPLGTANVFAFNMNLGKTWREACQTIRAGHTRRIDVGLTRPLAASATPRPAEGKPAEASREPKAKYEARYFLLMAGIGFDAKVVEDTSLRLKYVLRDFAYVLMTLQNVVLHQGTQVTLRFSDGRIYANESWLVMVGNAASYAWDIKVTSKARLDDGVLDICLMPFENKLTSIQQAMQILMGQHIERGTAQYWKTESVQITSDPPIPVQLDGDEWGYTPVEIKIIPSVLNVLAPPET